MLLPTIDLVGFVLTWNDTVRVLGVLVSDLGSAPMFHVTTRVSGLNEMLSVDGTITPVQFTPTGSVAVAITLVSVFSEGSIDHMRVYDVSVSALGG